MHLHMKAFEAVYGVQLDSDIRVVIDATEVTDEIAFQQWITVMVKPMFTSGSEPLLDVVRSKAKEP